MWVNDDENFTFAKCKHLHLMCNRKVLSWMFICKREFVHRFSSFVRFIHACIGSWMGICKIAILWRFVHLLPNSGTIRCLQNDEMKSKQSLNKIVEIFSFYEFLFLYLLHLIVGYVFIQRESEENHLCLMIIIAFFTLSLRLNFTL